MNRNPKTNLKGKGTPYMPEIITPFIYIDTKIMTPKVLLAQRWRSLQKAYYIN